MSAIEDIFSERLDLGDGSHIDLMLKEQEPIIGEKRFFRTYPPPPLATTYKKPDKLGRKRSRVLGMPIRNTQFPSRGLSGVGKNIRPSPFEI